MPDVFIPVDTARYTDYHRKLVASGLVNRVSMNYLDRNRNQMMAKYPKFQQYKQGFVVGEDIMEELLKMAGDEKIEFEEEQYNRSKPLIMLQIKALIARYVLDAFSDIRENRYVYHRRWLRHVAAYPAGCGRPGVDDERGLYRRFLRGPIVAGYFRREYSDLRGL